MWVIKKPTDRCPVDSDKSIVLIGENFYYETEREAYKAMLSTGIKGLIIQEVKRDE
jgi:hypothetical protein